MKELSEYILSSFQRRHFYKEKTAFIELLKEHYPQIRIDGPSGLTKSRNIILGDVESADVIFTAHYDTCSVFFMPNIIFVNNIIATILYSLLFVIPVFAAAIIIGILGVDMGLDPWIFPFCIFSATILLCVFLLWGIPSSTTANDNTSGTITLIELYEALSEEQRKRTAVVFLDNEELGLIGSYNFSRKYRKCLKDKLVINFDCVSDGKDMLFVLNRHTKHLKEIIAQCYSSDSIIPLIRSSVNTMYPSDQVNFRKSIGVASMHHCVFGYYIPRIHTNRDVIFDRDNIASLVSGSTALVSKLLSR